MPRTVLVDGQSLTFDDLISVARNGAEVALGPLAHENMNRSRAFVDAAATTDQPVYGITTGSGGLANVLVPIDDRIEMQHAVLHARATGLKVPMWPVEAGS